MLGQQPVNEGPPNRTQMIADALGEIDDQYSGIHEVLTNVGKVLDDMNKRLAKIERRLRK